MGQNESSPSSSNSQYYDMNSIGGEKQIPNESIQDKRFNSNQYKASKVYCPGPNFMMCFTRYQQKPWVTQIHDLCRINYNSCSWSKEVARFIKENRSLFTNHQREKFREIENIFVSSSVIADFQLQQKRRSYENVMKTLLESQTVSENLKVQIEEIFNNVRNQCLARIHCTPILLQEVSENFEINLIDDSLVPIFALDAPHLVHIELSQYFQKLFSFFKSVQCFNVVTKSLDKVLQSEDNVLYKLKKSFIDNFLKQYDGFVIVKGNSIRKIAEQAKQFLKFYLEIIQISINFEQARYQIEDKEIVILTNTDNLLNYLSGILFEETDFNDLIFRLFMDAERDLLKSFYDKSQQMEISYEDYGINPQIHAQLNEKISNNEHLFYLKKMWENEEFMANNGSCIYLGQQQKKDIPNNSLKDLIHVQDIFSFKQPGQQAASASKFPSVEKQDSSLNNSLSSLAGTYSCYDLIIEKIKLIQNVGSPVDQFKLLIESTHILKSFLSHVESENSQQISQEHGGGDLLPDLSQNHLASYNTDDLLGIFTYALIQSQVYMIHSHIKIIEHFLVRNTLNSLTGYILVTFQASVYHIAQKTVHNEKEQTEKSNVFWQKEKFIEDFENLQGETVCSINSDNDKQVTQHHSQETKQQQSNHTTPSLSYKDHNYEMRSLASSNIPPSEPKQNQKQVLEVSNANSSTN